MAEPAGLNQFISVPVPASSGDGAVLDVSALAAPKTFYLAGSFTGQYIILGTHDGSNFTPVESFDGGQGVQSIRRDVIATLKQIKVRRIADNTVTINLAAQAVCPC